MGVFISINFLLYVKIARYKYNMLHSAYMKEEQNEKEISSKKIIVTAIVFFLIGFGAAWLFTKPAEAPDYKNNIDEVVENKDVSTGINTLEVNDQKNSSTVSIVSVKLQNPGWVAIHDDVDGTPGNILGAAWFPKGENSGMVELLRDTEPEKTYFAVLHNDDGDKKFDHTIDVPLMNASNAVILVKFTTTDNQAIQ
ncbi:hypothetical protein C4565_03325 [Candidatus Parcubacteria bacterium]|jgi:hypothetical protein|nr:MAG: hypothetical protein C4565_03325 [Candidatus Parcubacteria bacterium]